MAINTNETTNETRQDSAPRQEARTTRTTTSTTRRGVGFGGAMKNVRRSFSRRATSEIVRAYKNAFDEIIGQNENYGEGNGQYKFYNFPIDGDVNGLPISSLVFVREEQGLSVALVVSLAATCDELPDRYVKTGRDQYGQQKQVGLPQTPSDIWEYSSTFRSVLTEAIEGRLGRGKYEVIGNIVLPAHVQSEDTDRITRTLWRIVDNLENHLVAKGKFDQVVTPSLELFNPDKEVLKTRLEFNQPQGEDALGNVRRQDINVRIISETGEKDDNGEQYVTEVGCVTGYIDAIMAGREPKPNDTIWTEANVQTFAPAFVITSLDSGQDAITAESIGFNLAAVSVLSADNRWMAAFRSNGTKNPLRHIGILGREIPELRSDIFDDGSYEPMGEIPPDTEYNHVKMARLAFYPDELHFLLDLEESGEMSPMLSAIMDIAVNNDKGSLQYWNDAMDHLTAGQYTRIWKEMGEPRIFEDLDLRIPLGTVRLEDNTEKEFDLRTLDQVAVKYLERENATLDEVEDYNEAFYGTMYDGENRTDIICRYVRSRFAGLVKFTGYARRIRILPALLEILSEAFVANRASIEPDRNFDGYAERRRGNAAFRSGGYSADNSGMFRRAGSQRASGSRWGNMRQGWRN